MIYLFERGKDLVVGTGLAAVFGVLISTLNYKLTAYILKKKPELFTMISIPRQIINVIYLVAVYLLASVTPWSEMELLVGAALGLTCSMFWFTRKLMKLAKPQENEIDGGDENG